MKTYGLVGWLVLGWAAFLGAGNAADKPAPEKPPAGPVLPWETQPTLEQIYERYAPSFGKGAPKYSKQPNFLNLAEVAMDAQVWPIISKANELAWTKKEPRRATELYRQILESFPDDVVQIAAEGIFTPASLYVQRQILRYPLKELNYYRILFDPPAKVIYERALRRCSIPDYKDLVRFHLATSYGDDALFALGNAALDSGRYNEAKRYYEQLVTYHGQQDDDKDDLALDRDQVWVRLAICYKHLNREGEFQAVLARIKNKAEPTVANLLTQLAAFKYDDFAVRQRENRLSPRYEALDDRVLSQPMPYPWPGNRGEWETPLPQAHWFDEPETRPWVTETDLVYKHFNVLYCRSLLTGQLNWAFGPGGSSQDWDWYSGSGGWSTDPPAINWYPEQTILVHEGVVLAHMFVFGPSLVAVDQFTGRQLWAKGPMAATEESEWLDRYQAAPAPSRGAVIVPVVHDDIRGRTHVSSTAELASYETRGGKLLWRTCLSRLAPLKLTQSRYARKLRIFSSRPLVSQGVVYHVTNAGVIAALDEQTGDIRWLTRYPQNEVALDNFSNPGRTWRNEPPLIRGNKLYVTPVDSGRLLCLDTESGRVLWTCGQNKDTNPAERTGQFGHSWRVAGFNAEGELGLTGYGFHFLDSETGRVRWGVSYWPNYDGEKRVVPEGSFVGGKNQPKGMEPAIDGEGNDFWWPSGIVEIPPRITADGTLYFCSRSYKGGSDGSLYADWRFDSKTRAITAFRRYFNEGFTADGQNMPPVAKRVVNEVPEPFINASRMTVTRWGVPFEINISNQKMVVRYDRQKLNGMLAQQNDLDSLFAKAEIARTQGDVMGAIKLFETCKPLLPGEEEDLRRNINLRLFPLYMEVARWGHQAGDLGQLGTACRNMGETASNPEQEIQALLAYAEYHEKKGDLMAAARVLQNASRHYWREPVRVSHLEVGDRKELLLLAQKGVEQLFGELPGVWIAGGGGQLRQGELGALEDYCLSVASVDLPHVIETRALIAARLRTLLGKGTPSFKEEYEAQAEKDLSQYKDPEIGERLLWCWPEAAGSKRKCGELLSKEGKGAQTAAEKQSLKWRYDDLARACGLGEGLVPGGKSGLELPQRPVLESGAGYQELETKNEDPEMVRLVLPQRGELGAAPQLLFVGGRKKRAYGNRFTVLCWDLKADKKAWESAEILLRGQVDGEEAYEVGFEEVFIQGELAIVHGRYDVIALRWGEGKDLRPDGKKEKAWHYKVPLGFEIQSMGQCGEVLLLCGRRSTLALSTRTNAPTGEVLWDAGEVGEYYAGPFFHEDQVFSVRKSPAEVSFRRLGTGRLLSRLSVPGLTTNRKHPLFSGESGEQSPAAAEAVAAYPVAYAEGTLVVVDGRTFHAIDVAQREIRWSRPADKLDPSVDAAFRLWIDGGRVFVLKPYYSVLENLVLDLKTGDMLWRRREGGKKVAAKLQKYAGAGGGDVATGLVLGSMTFVEGKVYGIKYEMNTSGVSLVGMDPGSGNQLLEVSDKGYTGPEAYVEGSLAKGCVVVRVQDGNNFELWQVDTKEKKAVQKLKLTGYGRLGEYGDVSMGWQGPHLAVWAYEKRKTNKP